MADPRINVILGAKDEASKVVTGLRGQFAKFKSDAVTGFGLGAGIGVFSLATKAIGAVVDVMSDAVRMAIEEEAGIALLTRSLEENSRGWDGNIDAIEEVISAREKLAFADGEQRDSLRQLVAVTKDHDEALAIQATAMDLARLKGIDLATASTVLGKVWAGNFVGLRKMGIILDETATSTDYLAEVQKRAAGQAEAYANTTQGKLVVASIALENAMETLGGALLPVVGQLATIASTSIPQIVTGVQDLLEEFGKFDPAFSRVVRVSDAVDELAETMGLSTKAADDMRQKWTAMARISEELDRSVAELVVGIGNEEKATIELDHWTQLHNRSLHAAFGATAALVEEDEDLARALQLVAGGFGDVRQQAKATEKQWRKVAEDGDRNRKAIRRLTDESVQWGRRYGRAIKANDSEAAAFAQAQQQRVDAELADRQLVVASLGNVKDAAKKIPNNVTVSVATPGAAAALAQLERIHQLASIREQGQIPVTRTPLGRGGADGDPDTPRAYGGPARAGRTYLVGERGPERLVMGSQSGYITPNHALGSGHGHAIYMDGRLVGKAVDERLGDRWSLTHAGSSYRRGD